MNCFPTRKTILEFRNCLANLEKCKIGCMTPGLPSGSHETRAVLSWIAAWRLRSFGIGPAARAGEEGAEIYLPSRLGPLVRRAARPGPRLLRHCTQRQHGAGKGLEFDVGRGGSWSGPGPGPTVVATGRRRAACPRPAICADSAALGPRGRPDGPGLDYTVSQCFKLLDWHTPPAHVVPRTSTLLFFSLFHGSWEGDTGHLPGSGLGLLSQFPYLTFKFESPGGPGLGSCPGRRRTTSQISIVCH